MPLAKQFPEITKLNEPLAGYTHLRIGGTAEYFLQPRSVEELKAVLAACKAGHTPVRMLGGGYNLLVRDEPVKGAVVRLTAPAFSFLECEGRSIRAGGGGQLYDLIALSVRSGLGGLETLVGIRGTVGGSVRCNVGDRTAEISETVRRVSVLTEAGDVQIRQREELTFSEHHSDLDEPVILSVEFELDADSPDALLKRLRKAWIQRKATEPLSFQASVRLFRNPPGQQAAGLIDRAGAARIKVGQAELSERNPNFVVAHPGATAADIISLVDEIRTRVKQRTGVSLEQELHVW